MHLLKYHLEQGLLMTHINLNTINITSFVTYPLSISKHFTLLLIVIITTNRDIIPNSIYTFPILVLHITRCPLTY